MLKDYAPMIPLVCYFQIEAETYYDIEKVQGDVKETLMLTLTFIYNVGSWKLVTPTFKTFSTYLVTLCYKPWCLNCLKVSQTEQRENDGYSHEFTDSDFAFCLFLNADG